MRLFWSFTIKTSITKQLSRKLSYLNMILVLSSIQSSIWYVHSHSIIAILFLSVLIFSLTNYSSLYKWRSLSFGNEATCSTQLLNWYYFQLILILEQNFVQPFNNGNFFKFLISNSIPVVLSVIILYEVFSNFVV